MAWVQAAAHGRVDNTDGQRQAGPKPPRGLPKSEFASRDYYDVWLPKLLASAERYKGPWTDVGTPQRLSQLKQAAAVDRECAAWRGAAAGGRKGHAPNVAPGRGLLERCWRRHAL